MTRVLEIRPTKTYALLVPENFEEDVEGDVASYWMAGDPLLLQLSSRARVDGAEIGAAQRLNERMQHPGHSQFVPASIAIDGCPDVAAAMARDGDGARWLFVYAVWPSLTVFATLVHPDHDILTPSWGLDAISSLRLA